MRLRLALPRLRLTGLRAAALQHGRQLRADSLLLTSPTLTMWPPAQPPPPLWQLLAPVLAGVQLQAATVRNATLRVADLEHAPMAQTVTINARHLRVDSAASADRRRILYAQSWTAHTGQLSATFDAPFYRAAVQHLRLNTATKSLSLTGIRLTPVFSPAQMNRRKGHQASAIGIRLPELTAKGFDFPLLAHTNQVQARLLTVYRPWVLIASDGRGSINPTRSVITPEAVRRVPLRFAVQRLDIAGGNLYTRYRSPRSPIVGTLSINRFQGSLFNLSNDPARQTTATPLTGHATAWLQNRSRLDVRVAIPVLDPRGRHRLWGSFGPAPFAILNPMTAPTRFLRFDHGDLHRLHFVMQADQQGIWGSMQAEYTGLKLSLLGYKNGELKQPLLKKVISKAANALVIRDDNPRHGRLMPGQIASQRERRFAVFVLWRQGLISGLLNSVGVPQKLAQKLSEGKDQGPLPK